MKLKKLKRRLKYVNDKIQVHNIKLMELKKESYELRAQIKSFKDEERRKK